MLAQSNLAIYPNPCIDMFYVSVTDQNALGSEISITNSIGELIWVEKLNSLNQAIAVNHFSKGIYIVKISNNQSSSSKKLIIN